MKDQIESSVSDKMDKTIVVVTVTVKHPHKKIIARSKFKAHDGKTMNTASACYVLLMETRPSVQAQEMERKRDHREGKVTLIVRKEDLK